MERVKTRLREVRDFPKAGIIFKDITPVLSDFKAFNEALDEFEKRVRKSLASGQKIDKVVAVESRGFIFGAPLALRLQAGLVLARKPGKLPAKKKSESFKLEYGSDTLEMHEDSIDAGENVLIVDDVLDTCGTMDAVE
jgi:adenine phosphoribosyltransferase